MLRDLDFQMPEQLLFCWHQDGLLQHLLEQHADWQGQIKQIGSANVAPADAGAEIP